MLRVDLHLHSSASFDCRFSPEAMAAAALRLGLSPIFLTDHDTIDGARHLAAVQPAPVVTGQEVTTADGEVIGLFLEEAIPSGLPSPETAARIHSQGGLVYLEHPYDLGRRCLSEAAIEQIADDIDIVEVFNGRSPAEANRRAQDLCDALGAAAGAGSDAHQPGELGSAYVELAEFDGARDFLDKLRAGRVVTRRPRWRLRTEAALRTLVS